MARSDQVLRRVRFAYERTRILDGLRGLAIATALIVLAVGLHRITSTSWLVGAVLAASLGALGWRGGALRRGAFSGVLAGLPTLIVPSIVVAMSQHGHCASCGTAAAWPCMLSCLVTSSVVGMIVGHRAINDASPRRFAMSSIATAALTGLLGCATVGLGGAMGVVVGLVAGGITGWVARGRATAM
jgi:hypothetical protein